MPAIGIRVTGVTRWTRHPIYTGMLLALLGTALAVGEQRGWLGFVLVFIGLRFKLRHEEAWMRERFGDAYVDYMRRVKMLIPGVLQGRGAIMATTRSARSIARLRAVFP